MSDLIERINNRRRKKRRRNIICAVVVVCVIALAITAAVKLHTAYNPQPVNDSETAANIIEPTSSPETEITPEPTEEPTEEPTPEPTPEPTEEPVSARGTAVPIPDDIKTLMSGKSMPSGASVSYDDLRYLTIPHYDFDYNVVTGELIVNKAVAEEVLDIFEKLFYAKYPIERMRLVDYYNADDYTSIEANNTSAFNYRVSTDGSGRLSRHALGLAIDINPQINPYVNSSGRGSHQNAAEYWSRNYKSWSSAVAQAAYIGTDSYIYKVFVNEYGWEWGGSWSSYRDYQHFQKSL